MRTWHCHAASRQNAGWLLKAGLLVAFCVSITAASCVGSTPLTNGSAATAHEAPEHWTFVSFPDFFNFDVPEPWPQWDPAVYWFLTQVTNEMPDFVLVAGDLVDGHWWDGPKCIEHMGAVYYEAWKRRMARFGLRYFVAVGDHELGDDPWPPDKLALVPHFERVFAQHMHMPTNGPQTKPGLAYYVLHKNLLLITVETFEVINGSMHVTVGEDQLKWLQNVLSVHTNVAHIVVQGHAPVIGQPAGRSTSYLMITNGAASPFWQLLKNAGVDLYLCGEYHAVTATYADGVWQIVHGSSWGRDQVDTMDYLVCHVYPDRLELQMKSFPFICRGQFMWNLNKPRGPREIVQIPEHVLQTGPEIKGTLTIKKTPTGKQFLNPTGCFQ